MTKPAKATTEHDPEPQSTTPPITEGGAQNMKQPDDNQSYASGQTGLSFEEGTNGRQDDSERYAEPGNTSSGQMDEDTERTTGGF